MSDIYGFLDQHGITYDKHEHAAVFTCGEAEKELRADIGGMHTKNLFLRDKKGRRHFLVIVGYEKSVDLAALRTALDLSKLSFGSDERLETHLGVTPGSVTLLALVNDPEHNVELIVDQALWDADAILCHPLVNTATLVIQHDGLETFLRATGHEPTIMEVPGL